jgi:hypothetical protein
MTNVSQAAATANATDALAAARPLTIARLSDVAGAEIHGIDLAKPITPELCDAILEAFVAHHILVFRDQHLTKDQQHAFTLNFGELEEHVGRLPDGTQYPPVHTVTNLDAETGCMRFRCRPRAVTRSSQICIWVMTRYLRMRK